MAKLLYLSFSCDCGETMRMTDTIASRCSGCGRDIDVRRLSRVFSDKTDINPAEVHYMDEAPNRDQSCARCIHYEAGECALISGEVSADGTCDLFKSPRELAERRKKAGLSPVPAGLWPVYNSPGGGD